MKKIISIALALVMLITAFMCVSCKKKQESDGSSVTTVSDGAAVSGEETTDLFYTAGQEEIDKYGLNGYELNIFARSLEGEFSITDLVVGDDYNISNAVDSAVYARQIALEEKFGFTMKLDRSTYTSWDDAKELELQLASGMCEYDIAFPMARKAAVMASSGQLYDLNKLAYFDVDSGAWNKTFCDNLEWNGKLCFAVGGISVTNAYNSIRCFMFNKQLASEFGYRSAYKLCSGVL